MAKQVPIQITYKPTCPYCGCEDTNNLINSGKEVLNVCQKCKRYYKYCSLQVRMYTSKKIGE